MASNFDISFDEEELSSTQEEICRCNSLESEKLKNEVISMCEEVEQFFNSDGYSEDLRLELRELYPDFLNELRERRKDMDEYDHGIVIAGETCSGKSSLINCLLGKRIFETPNLESSSTICKLRNSRRINIITKTHDGEHKEDLTDICYLSTEKGEAVLRDTLDEVTNITFTRGLVQSVDVGFPIPFLKGNTILVDTPGIGGSGTVSKKLLEYLPNAASFIFVIDVGSSGGLQNDRLPVILKEILLLQAKGEMPQFKIEDVLFVTNKWDTIRCVVSDDKKRNSTWETLQKLLKDIWPDLNIKNIFRMNLIEVSSDENNSSTKEFERFKKVLETNVMKAENIRVGHHLRFLRKFLTTIFKGLNHRLQLTLTSEHEQNKQARVHQREIDRVTRECEEARHTLQNKLDTTIERISEECYEIMSTVEGKRGILNPQDLPRIDSFSLILSSKIIRKRVMNFFNTFLHSKEVWKQFEMLLGECHRFHERIALDLLNMENEWMDRWIQNMSDDHLDVQFECGHIEISRFKILLHLVLTHFGTFATIKQQSINEIYNKWKDESRRLIRDHLNSNIGLVFGVMITRVTDDILPRGIQSFERTIQHLSENREEILDNQKSLSFLVTKVTHFKNKAEDLHDTFVKRGLLTEQGMC